MNLTNTSKLSVKSILLRLQGKQIFLNGSLMKFHRLQNFYGDHVGVWLDGNIKYFHVALFDMALKNGTYSDSPNGTFEVKRNPKAVTEKRIFYVGKKSSYAYRYGEYFHYITKFKKCDFQEN
jgi:hypothetical protein